MDRRFFLAVLLLVAVAVCAVQPAGATREEPTDAQIVRQIVHWRKQTWHWQTVLGKRRSPSAFSSRTIASRDYKLWVLQLWKERAGDLWKQAQRPPHKQQWLCIHRYEGHWRSTPGGPGILNSGGPYYGGLQMDLEFQRTYGGYLLRMKGTADRWSPLEQMWVAEHAYKTRRFYPWPNTARWCGLI